MDNFRRRITKGNSLTLSASSRTVPAYSTSYSGPEVKFNNAYLSSAELANVVCTKSVDWITSAYVTISSNKSLLFFAVEDNTSTTNSRTGNIVITYNGLSCTYKVTLSKDTFHNITIRDFTVSDASCTITPDVTLPVTRSAYNDPYIGATLSRSFTVTSVTIADVYDTGYRNETTYNINRYYSADTTENSWFVIRLTSSTGAGKREYCNSGFTGAGLNISSFALDTNRYFFMSFPQISSDSYTFNRENYFTKTLDYSNLQVLIAVSPSTSSDATGTARSSKTISIPSGPLFQVNYYKSGGNYVYDFSRLQ